MAKIKDEIKDVGEEILSAFTNLMPNKRVESIVSLEKKGSEWEAVVEVLERRAVPDSQDLLGRYEVKLSGNEIAGYKQVSSRHRGEVMKAKET